MSQCIYFVTKIHVDYREYFVRKLQIENESYEAHKIGTQRIL